MKMECTNCHITLNQDELIDKYNNKCPMCNRINTYVPEYIMDIKRISTDESFIQAMTKLHDEGSIEYQLKMSQFKSQLNQQESSNSSQNNILRCPTCSSTKIKRISTTSKAVGAFMFGLFSKTAKSQFCCEHCGYKW